MYNISPTAGIMFLKTPRIAKLWLAGPKSYGGEGGGGPRRQSTHQSVACYFTNTTNAARVKA